MARAWMFGCTIALAATLARPGARAQSSAETEASAVSAEDGEARVERARRHFVLGMQFFEVRAFRDAIREFELATALAPSAEVWFNIGRAREELGEYEQAKHAFERYLRDRVDAPDADAVRARIRRIEQRVRAGDRLPAPPRGTGSLRIHLDPARAGQAEVTLDGKAVREAHARPIILPAGRHRLEVQQLGHVPFRAELSIEPGMLTAAHVQLSPLSEPARPERSSRGWTWVALGVASAGVVGTGILSGVAIDRLSAGEVDSARSWARRADMALLGTSVCALAAALLYFAEAPARTPTAADAAYARAAAP